MWRGRAAHLRRFVRTFAIDPAYALDDAVEDLCRRRERPATAVDALRAPEWERRLHERLDLPWPCAESAEAGAVWRAAAERLRRAGVAMGRGAFAGWDDGDPALARATWCATRHLGPERVVETGVARGITTATILEALRRNGAGHLWSVDLPPPLRPELAVEVGLAVPAELRDRWSLVSGTSRRRLPALLAELGAIDLFLHDSLHTGRNIRFELERAWAALRPGGVAIVDDVHLNDGFGTWAAGVPAGDRFVCLPDDERALFAIVVRQSPGAGDGRSPARGLR